MKIAIVETEHFQYGLTQSELFSGADKLFFVTETIHREMMEYDTRLCDGKFILIDTIDKDVELILKTCKEEKIDLFLMSPMFNSYRGVLHLSEKITCRKIITIHNLNFWLKARFHSWNSWIERRIKQKICKNFDFIAVEDFIYGYLERENKRLFKKYKFIYIPFTIFHPDKVRTFHKTNSVIKIVLPGSIHKDRRRYEDVVQVIHRMAKEKLPVKFAFAGPPIGEYGRQIIEALAKANEIHQGIVSYFPERGEILPQKFLEEMETSDLVLSTSTKFFKAFGTTELIGKTKPTAAIHDMMSFQLPGLLPSHLTIPENLKGSVFNYSGENELYDFIKKMIDSTEFCKSIQEKARVNSLHYTAEKVRSKLPFSTT